MYLEIEAYDATLTARQRTALGLGPIGSDPRDAAVRVIVVVPGELGGVRAVATFHYAFHRATTSRSQLGAALVSEARARIAAEQDGEGETRLVGSRFRF